LARASCFSTVSRFAEGQEGSMPAKTTLRSFRRSGADGAGGRRGSVVRVSWSDFGLPECRLRGDCPVLTPTASAVRSERRGGKSYRHSAAAKGADVLWAEPRGVPRLEELETAPSTMRARVQKGLRYT